MVDIGCGTGSLALRLANQGMSAIGVDPATASLDVARAKPGAERVTFLDGDAAALDGLSLDADLAVMTGNVAQVFVDDNDWSRTLDAIYACLRPRGWLAFETRVPAVRAWEEWDIVPTPTELPSGNTAVVSRTVTDVTLPLVTFESAVKIKSPATIRLCLGGGLAARPHEWRTIFVLSCADTASTDVLGGSKWSILTAI